MAAVAPPEIGLPGARLPPPSTGQRGFAESWPRRVVGYALTPALLAVALAALYVYVANHALDEVEHRSLNSEYISTRVVQHLELTVAVTALVILIAVPAGILLTRPLTRRVAPLLVGLANIGQAVPSIGVLVLLALVIGIGPVIAVAAFVLYAILPVLRNTMVGLQQVAPAVIEAGRGMGMSKTRVLAQIELPLAVPVVLAGVRTALVISVGTVALATFVNAGGLGDIINNGITTNRTVVTVTGSVLTAVLALLVDWLAGIAEDLLRPRGL